jgi:hypothetical protein
MRSTGPVAKRLLGDQQAAAQYIPLARKLLGRMKQRMQLGDIAQLYDSMPLPDGGTIRAAILHGKEYVWIQPTSNDVGEVDVFADFFTIPDPLDAPSWQYPYLNGLARGLHLYNTAWSSLHRTPIFDAGYSLHDGCQVIWRSNNGKWHLSWRHSLVAPALPIYKFHDREYGDEVSANSYYSNGLEPFASLSGSAYFDLGNERRYYYEVPEADPPFSTGSTIQSYVVGVQSSWAGAFEDRFTFSKVTNIFINGVLIDLTPYMPSYDPGIVATAAAPSEDLWETCSFLSFNKIQGASIREDVNGRAYLQLIISGGLFGAYGSGDAEAFWCAPLDDLSAYTWDFIDRRYGWGPDYYIFDHDASSRYCEAAGTWVKPLAGVFYETSYDYGRINNPARAQNATWFTFNASGTEACALRSVYDPTTEYYDHRAFTKRYTLTLSPDPATGAFSVSTKKTPEISYSRSIFGDPRNCTYYPPLGTQYNYSGTTEAFVAYRGDSLIVGQLLVSISQTTSQQRDDYPHVDEGVLDHAYNTSIKLSYDGQIRSLIELQHTYHYDAEFFSGATNYWTVNIDLNTAYESTAPRVLDLDAGIEVWETRERTTTSSLSSTYQPADTILTQIFYGSHNYQTDVVHPGGKDTPPPFQGSVGTYEQTGVVSTFAPTFLGPPEAIVCASPDESGSMSLGPADLLNKSGLEYPHRIIGAAYAVGHRTGDIPPYIISAPYQAADYSGDPISGDPHGPKTFRVYNYMYPAGNLRNLVPSYRYIVEEFPTIKCLVESDSPPCVESYQDDMLDESIYYYPINTLGKKPNL